MASIIMRKDDWMMSDWELLERYARGKDEGAFAELVNGHVDMVYGAARRRLGAGRGAEDVVQAVFLLLSQKAGRMRAEGSLGGWLYRATGYCCADVKKSESARRRREREAGMQRHEAADVAEDLGPMLDEALERLGEKERQAIVVRFLEGKTAAETGVALGISAGAVEKRLERGLRKLRGVFASKGYTVPAVGVAGALIAEGAKAAPAGLALSASGVTTGVNATAAGIARGAAWMMKMAMLKTGAAVAMVSVVAVLLLVAAGELARSSDSGAGDVKSAAGAPSPPSATTAPKTVQATRIFAGNAGSIVSLAFSPDGKLLASTALDKTLRLWDMETGKQVRKLEWPGNSGASDMAFSADGKLLATSGYHNDALVWEVATGKPIANLQGHTSGVVGVAFRANGKELVTCSVDGTIRRWNVETEKEIGSIEISKDYVTTSLSLSADEKRVVCGVREGLELVFDIESGRLVGRISKPEETTHDVSVACLSPKGDRVIVSWLQSWVREFDVESGEMLQEWKAKNKKIEFTWVGQSWDGTVAVASAANGLLIMKPGTNESIWLPCVTPQMKHATLSPDGRYLAAGGGFPQTKEPHRPGDHLIYVWKLEGGSPVDGEADLKASLEAAKEANAAPSVQRPVVTEAREIVISPATQVSAVVSPTKVVDEATVKSRVDTVMKELGSASFQTREAGMKHLKELPAEAYPQMEKAVAATSDAEVKSRLQGPMEELQGKYGAMVYHQRKAKERAWLAANAIASYQAVGARGIWDEDAQACLQIMLAPPEELEWQALAEKQCALLSKTIAEGCTDPLVKYFNRLMIGETDGANWDERIRRFNTAYQGMAKSNYPALWKLIAADGYLTFQHERELKLQNSSDRRKVIFAVMDAMPPWWKEALKEKEVPDDVLFGIANRLVDYRCEKDWEVTDRAEYFSRYFESWISTRPDSSAAYALRSQVYATYAAMMFLEDRRKVKIPIFGPASAEERRAVAREAGQKAWELNPYDPQGPAMMVRLAYNSPRDVMEKWFQRAARLRPESCEVFIGKAWWLERHGLREEEMAFADECVKHADIKSAELFLTLQIHLDRAQWDKEKYFERPDVFPGLQLMYEKVLSYEPDNREFRSWYAFYAMKAKQWAVAKKQFDMLGNHPSLAPFGSQSVYELDRDRATKMSEGAGGNSGK